MDSNVSKILLGLLGEKIVAHYLRSKGYQVEESLDIFDSSKDMKVNDLKVEVKTQVPFVVYDSFAVNENQLNKMKGCRYVFFVSCPLQTVDDSYAGCVFCLDMQHESLKIERKTLKNGRNIICFPRKQEAMRNVHRVTDTKILSQMKQLSTSYL